MHISQIHLTKKITINKGNYESLSIEASYTMDILPEDQDDEQFARNKLSELVNNDLRGQANMAKVMDTARFGV